MSETVYSVTYGGMTQVGLAGVCVCVCVSALWLFPGAAEQRMVRFPRWQVFCRILQKFSLLLYGLSSLNSFFFWQLYTSDSKIFSFVFEYYCEYVRNYVKYNKHLKDIFS